MAPTSITQFFAYTQMRNVEIFHLGELQQAWGISLKQETNLLSYLVKQKIIIRLRRGIYLVPQKIPPGGKWQPDSLYIISVFMDIIKANYFISGLYAFNHYKLSKQVPSIIDIYNDKLSAKKKLGNLTLQLIKVPSYQIGYFTSINLKESKSVRIANLSRSLLDAVMDWSRFGTLPEALEWIKKHLTEKQFIDEFIKCTMRYGNVSARRRIGYILYKEIPSASLIKKLLETIPVTKNWVLLDPTGKKSGTTNKLWRIVDNVATE